MTTTAESLYAELDRAYHELARVHQALSNCYAPGRRGAKFHAEFANRADLDAAYTRRSIPAMAPGLSDSAQETVA